MRTDLTGDHPDAIRLRLRALPEALGYDSQTAFAQHLGIGVSRYSNAILTGVVSKELALTIYRRSPGIRLEWLLVGDRSMMPPAVMLKIEEWLQGSVASEVRVTRAAADHGAGRKRKGRSMRSRGAST